MNKKNVIKLAEARPLLLKGHTLQETANETGLSLTQIKIYKKEIKQEFLELLKSGKSQEILETILLEYLITIEQAQEDLAVLKTQTKQDSIRLGTINATTKLAQSKIETLQSLLLLPKKEIQKTEINNYNMYSIEEYLQKRRQENAISR